MTMKQEKTALGFYTPELMQRLTPVPGLLSDATIQGVLRKPMDAIAIMNGRFARIAEDYRRNTAMGYDPHENLLQILSLQNPMLPVGSMLIAVAAARPANDHVFSRKEAILHVCAQAALRRGTIAAAPVTSLIRRNGMFTLRIEGRLFKNRKAARFAHGNVFEKNLADYCGCYEALDRYLDFGRKATGMSHDPALFVTQRGALCAGQVYNDMHDMTGRFLSEDGFEGVCMPGVSAFGPGGFRHILATHFLKQSRDLLMAAEAIHDDPKTVFDHYARYAPQDLRAELARQWAALAQTSKTQH